MIPVYDIIITCNTGNDYIQQMEEGFYMLKDIPYRTLKQDERTYEIMLLRDQYDNTFTDIAKEYEISVARVVQIYNKLKVKQACLYINHIAVTLGLESTSQINKVYYAAYECYQERSYACAYLEKKYQAILIEYRDREPGMPMQFMKSMPPFKPLLGKKTIARVVSMRETEKASFVEIGKEMRITRAKAKRIYEMYYHEKVLALIEALQEKAESHEEKRTIWNDCFRGNKSSKKRYEMLIQK